VVKNRDEKCATRLVDQSSINARVEKNARDPEKERS